MDNKEMRIIANMVDGLHKYVKGFNDLTQESKMLVCETTEYIALPQEILSIAQDLQGILKKQLGMTDVEENLKHKSVNLTDIKKDFPDHKLSAKFFLLQESRDNFYLDGIKIDVVLNQKHITVNYIKDGYSKRAYINVSKLLQRGEK